MSFFSFFYFYSSVFVYFFFFFFKQKTAYEVRIRDGSSDVCSSDLLGTDVAARNGIRAVPVDRPFRERPDVGFVEALEPGLAERRGRAQLAGAKGGQRPARRLNGFGDPFESVGQRYGRGEADQLDSEAGQCRDARGLLEYARQISIAAELETGCRDHRPTTLPPLRRWRQF